MTSIGSIDMYLSEHERFIKSYIAQYEHQEDYYFDYYYK